MSVLDEAKGHIQSIEDGLIAFGEFGDLDELMKKNESDRRALFLLVEDALRRDSKKGGKLSLADRARMESLRDSWKTEYNLVQEKYRYNSDAIRATTQGAIEGLVTDQDRLGILADLNQNELLDDDVADFVTEKNLKKALSRASNGGANLDEMYRRVTDAAPDWQDPAETGRKFHTALRASIQLIRQVTNGNAGLDAFLMGKTDVFIAKVRERVAKNDGKPLPIEIQDSSALPAWGHNVIGAVVTAGVGYLSEGMVTAWHEKHSVTAEWLIEKIEAQKEGGVINTGSEVLTWIKEAIMGRRLSWTFLGEDRVEKYTKDVTAHAERVMKLTPENLDSTIASSSGDSFGQTLAATVRTMKQAKMDPKNPEDFKVMQKALIQSYIINTGTEQQGVNWSASIGVLMLLGVHRDAVGVAARETKGGSDYNKAEWEATRRKIDMGNMPTGMIVEQKDGKWVYTIPSEIQLVWDTEKLPVLIEGAEPVNGFYIREHDTPKVVRFSDIGGGGYSVSFADADKVQITSDKQETRNLREVSGNKSLAQRLYAIGHNHRYDDLVKKLGKQDYAGAIALLEAMKSWKNKADKELATVLLADRDNIGSWTTYMYGSASSRDQDKNKYTQGYIDSKVRTKAVIDAENKIAKDNGIIVQYTEGNFRLDGAKSLYEAKKASELFPGQNMTMAVFATPKGGAHRIDTYDGSIMMSGQYVDIPTHQDTIRKKIVEAIVNNTSEAAGVKMQFGLFSEFVNKKVSADQKQKWNEKSDKGKFDAYVDYLATGDISKLDIEGLVAQKEPRIFEGRAMIQGNMCLNRSYGIVYPLFETQMATSVIERDTSTPLAQVDVSTTQSVAGATPLGLIKFAKKQHDNVTKEPPSPPSPPSSSGATTTPGWGGSAGGTWGGTGG